MSQDIVDAALQWSRAHKRRASAVTELQRARKAAEAAGQIAAPAERYAASRLNEARRRERAARMVLLKACAAHGSNTADARVIEGVAS